MLFRRSAENYVGAVENAAATYKKYNAGDLVYFDPASDSSSCSSDSDVYSSKGAVKIL